MENTMRQLLDSVWQVRGTSWLWDEEARNQICRAGEVWSLRQLLRAQGNWPDELPSNSGRTLVVAGLDASLDVLVPDEAQTWLDEAIKPAILAFQDEWEGDGALVFWLPGGQRRIKLNTATDEVGWLCHAPHGHPIDFGRILWGQANEYPQEILLQADGKAAGLFHARIT